MSSYSLVIALLLCWCLQVSYSEPPSVETSWTWVGGSKSMYGQPVYGHKGVPNSENMPDGRYGAFGWYDNIKQELWLFGGISLVYGFMNDLWRYRVNDSTWTWMAGSNIASQPGVYGEKGIPSVDNYPGARYRAVGWYDSLRDEFWLFGGYGYVTGSTEGYLNDLWRHRVNDSTWTWISGTNTINQRGVYGEKGNASTANVPGAREGAVGWYDSSTQEMWLFGGIGYSNSSSGGRLNDLWRYRVNDSTWTWISGSDTTNQPSVYGERGVPSTNNSPGAREYATGCYDSITQEFWLFGGDETTIIDPNTSVTGYLNDLWRYRVNDSTWTWISGSNTTNEPGVYGEKGNAGIETVPGARSEAIGWCDGATKELWIFGGQINQNVYNDLWRFNISDSTWTWMSGSNIANHLGVFDTKGVPNEDFMPRARRGAAGWYDNNTKEIWLFSGFFLYSSGYINDLWRYRVNDSTWTWMSGSVHQNNFGVYGDKGHPNSSNIPGGRRLASGWFDCSSQELWLFGGYGFGTLSGKESGDLEGYLNDLWRYRLNDSTWTWMSGNNTANQPSVYGEKDISNSNNQPGSRYVALGWYDSLRQVFWLFGGFGYGDTKANIGFLNDLWRYEVNNNTWTWISGSNETNHGGVYGVKSIPSIDNVPSGRSNAVGWFDISTNEMWLFGGYNLQGYLNDLWRYRVNDSTWTWISGSNLPYQRGIYGEKGISSPTNHPGARDRAVGWYDSLREEFWLFGGYGSGNTSSLGYLNDLWKYEVKNNTWTWMAGSTTNFQRGVYGLKGKASVNNVPGSRHSAVGWYDSSTQELWLFGGIGYSNSSSGGRLNDLWRYRVKDNTWTWIAGSIATNQRGVYGEKGISNSDNNPGSRQDALALYDSCTHTAILFGGEGHDEFSFGYLNDVWRLSWVEICTPHHQLINNTCIPLIDCSSDKECTLQCGEASSSPSTLQEHSGCLIDEDLIVNGSILESSTIAIVGVINVTGDVRITGDVTVELSVGSELHVGRCLILEDESTVMVVVSGNEGTTTNGSIVLSYDSSCSSPHLIERVGIESSWVDECRDGTPTLREQAENGEGGRAYLALMFLAVDSNECKSESELNVVAIAVVVPVGVLLVALTVILMIPKVREKILPAAAFWSCFKRRA